ncbi:putative 4-coumarateligase [Diaporthe ampelina]|uniref:Putative 4-coumarateligase n=1 Tax=Diaporthe ampelina TaxID=1214573 RepID=A0A0G2ICI3_9PEZI|nr:putative 4-coumarateligase [Diaporthe ampelina]
MATTVHRGPGGSIVYKAAEHLDIPSLDLLTALFDSEICEADDKTIISADAADPQHKHLTRARTRQLTTQLAHALRHTYGIGRQGRNRDVVLVNTQGHYMLPTLFYSTVAAGGIYSAASPSSTASELAYLVGLVEPKVIICDAHTQAVTEETVRQLKFPAERLLVLGDDRALELRGQGAEGRLELSPSRTLQWERITNPKELEESIICILFSSGTTGLPKGVKLSHLNLLAEACVNMEPAKEWEARERPGLGYITLAHLPAAHIAGVQGYLVNVLYRGGTIYWMPKFDFAKFIEYTKRYSITNFFSVPPIYLALAKFPGITDQFDTIDHAFSGAAPLSSEIQAEAGKKMGKGRAKLTQVWGLTETTGAITAMPPGETDPTGSVGPLVANHEARIVDEESKDVEPGERGEIWVRGPVVTKGYWRNTKADAESFVDGWFCSGDIGLYKDGMFYIVDRKKELIKYKGLQVAPAELEAVLLSHPEIADAAVIGVEKDGTEVPRAYVVPGTKELTSEQIASWVDGKVANHKKLRGGVMLVDAIPRSPSGKILRKILRDQAKAAKAEKTLARL